MYRRILVPVDEAAEVDRAIDDDGIGRHTEAAGHDPLMTIELGDEQAGQAALGQHRAEAPGQNYTGRSGRW